MRAHTTASHTSAATAPPLLADSLTALSPPALPSSAQNMTNVVDLVSFSLVLLVYVELATKDLM
jgi:hypothetical protein